jgi:hypothetical protein
MLPIKMTANARRDVPLPEGGVSPQRSNMRPEEIFRKNR